MLAVLVIGVGLGWEFERVRAQRRAVATIRAAGGRALYDYEVDARSDLPIPNAQSPAPTRWRRLFGDDFFHNVVAVEIHDRSKPMPRVPPGAKLRVDDQQVAALGRLAALRSLDLNYSDVDDSDLERLRSLRRLKRLWLLETNVTDAGLAHLRSFPALEVLDLRGTRVCGAGMEAVGQITSLVDLGLDRTNVGDDGAKRLRNLTRLQILTLSHTRVGDSSIPAFEPLQDLRFLDLSRARLSRAGERDALLKVPSKQIYFGHIIYPDRRRGTIGPGRAAARGKAR
ncbi:MAG TPA: hypothetical protein VG406_21605 [Isosphaeraceae bacterium]|jgi:Leucine-rich repeat (LRR) protein|nr:hypothetical protein [Isosphaeraceae bacterium]